MTNASKNTVESETLFEASYLRVQPELPTLLAQKVKQVNLDIPSAVVTMLAVVARLAPYRDTILYEFRSFDIDGFDRLEDYTLALSHAHALYVTAGTPPEVPRHIYDKGFRLRETLHADVKVLIGRGLIQSTVLKAYRGLIGYENIASELQILCQVLKEHWPLIQTKCAISPAEIAHASRIAAQLLRVAKQRDKLPELVAEAADRRNRCFTLFIDTYTEARCAIQYLRRHDGDADDIAPLLYTGRGNGRKRRPHEPAPSPSSGNTNAARSTTSIGAADDTALAANGPFLR